MWDCDYEMDTAWRDDHPSGQHLDGLLNCILRLVGKVLFKDKFAKHTTTSGSPVQSLEGPIFDTFVKTLQGEIRPISPKFCLSQVHLEHFKCHCE